MRLLALVVTVIALSACQGAAEYAQALAESSVPVGSRLILNQSLSIPSDTAHVRLQSGEIRSAGAIKQYYPNCNFRLRTRTDAPQKLEPDTFIIFKVEYGKDIVAGDNVQRYYSEMHLRSEKQPNVFMLACQQWNKPPDSSYVTVDQIRVVLGEIFILELAE